jgi:two-component system, NtrC family, sensor kinase
LVCQICRTRDEARHERDNAAPEVQAACSLAAGAYLVSIMAPSSRIFRLSFQTKVMMAVLIVLVPLPVLTVWLVSNHLGQQMFDEARQTLTSAEDGFVKSLEIRSKSFLSRYQIVANEARVRVVADLGDQKTMDRLVRDLIHEAPEDTQVMLFATAPGVRLAGVSREANLKIENFEQSAAELVRIALLGEPVSGSFALDGRAYNVVAVPVAAEKGPVIGALVVGIRITNATVLDMRSPRTEILLLDGRNLTASTLQESEHHDELLAQIGITELEGAGASTKRAVQRVVLNGQHYLALNGAYDVTKSRQGFRYVLLSSYETRLRTLEETRRTLVMLSAAGILLGAAAVWFFLQRITQPLRELRDLAEAVGHGDFSRKIERFSNDECGELAEEFNEMTSKLQSSRSELEKTVSTLKDTQAQLVQSEKLSAVGQFVAGVAHELNNPLTTVIGFADVLASDETNEKNRRHLELVVKSAHRCHKIVHSLLSFARQHAPERRIVEVNSLVDDVIDIMAYDLRTSNITVVKEYGSELPSLMADAHQLQQVFVNILSNARQAIEPFRRDGSIIVRTRRTGSVVRIELQDNGPGIRAESLSKIFDPFFTTKPVGKGTGLGLSLSYGIIQEHGGKITVQSEVGQGATFVIELPVAEGSAALHSGTAKPWTGKKFAVDTAGKSVLVIDDEVWILELSKELLRTEGYQVEVAASGEEAFQRITQQRFDVILSDWKMPGLNGMHLYEQLRATDPVSARKMIFMTGDVMNEAFQEFLKRNGRAYLAKPFAIGDLRMAVASLLV